MDANTRAHLAFLAASNSLKDGLTAKEFALLALECLDRAATSDHWEAEAMANIKNLVEGLDCMGEDELTTNTNTNTDKKESKQ